MLYTDKTKRAATLCFEAHKNQRDKAGLPYIFHPVHLAEQVNPEDPDAEDLTCVALLHDVMEDTDITYEEIAALGFSQETMDALALLCHDPAVPYMDYVAEIGKNPVARRVKMLDLRHNMDLSRLDAAGPKDRERVEKYRQAYRMLESLEQ